MKGAKASRLLANELDYLRDPFIFDCLPLAPFSTPKSHPRKHAQSKEGVLTIVGPGLNRCEQRRIAHNGAPIFTIYDQERDQDYVDWYEVVECEITENLYTVSSEGAWLNDCYYKSVDDLLNRVGNMYSPSDNGCGCSCRWFCFPNAFDELVGRSGYPSMHGEIYLTNLGLLLRVLMSKY